jgi:hypothetical protein
MMRSKILCVAALMAALTGSAMAADCVLNITRTACPGQEQESYSKCGGQQSCTEKKPAATAAQCLAKAKDMCKNSRLTVTKYKKVTAEFDGTALEGGKDFCVGHPDFPYASKPDCK